MKIFDSQSTKEIDAYTIGNEPISSIDLMERASSTLVQWIIQKYANTDQKFIIFSGPGNNGGDGLAVARLLHEHHYPVKVYTLHIGKIKSVDFIHNLNRLTKKGGLEIVALEEGSIYPSIANDEIVVDAIFGNGLSRTVEGYWAELISYINREAHTIIAIDMPSGVFSEQASGSSTIHATYTLTFQYPKLAFFQPENQKMVGKWEVLDIGLNQDIMEKLDTHHHFITKEMVSPMLRLRERYDHKGTFGHALLICGGFGKVGAAILAAKACLRSGVGRLTVHVPKYAYTVIQTSIPEAMAEVDDHVYWFSGREGNDDHQSIGIGCGLGQKAVTVHGLESLITQSDQPLVLDADALNIIAHKKILLEKLPPGSILTPHPGEYKRLFGSNEDSFSRLKQQIQLSSNHHLNIVLKGAHTCITTPDGRAFFNSTGNPGMATAGSGDVLTGIITGLLAQGLSPTEAAISSVYIHGLAGDLAVKKVGQFALIASDIIDHLGPAFCQIKPRQS